MRFYGLFTLTNYAMAKDLPYFKFVISEWNDGDVTLCSLEAQGLFINLCSIYWSQEGNMSLAKSKRRFNNCNATAWESLINDKVIKVKGDRIIINFLDEQFKERGKLSSTNSENASKGWEKRRNNTNEVRPHTDGIEVASNIEEKRTEERREEEKKKEENKIAEITATKVATIEDRQKAFMEKLTPYLPDYSKEMLREFFDYWVEKNDGGRKMRFEMQKVFDVSRRLKTWSKNNYNNGTRINGKREQGINSLKEDFAKRVIARNSGESV